VKYEIEDTRVGQRTNYDKLIMEIWTNGTITPQLAIVEGAKIMRKHLNPFIQYAEPGPEIAVEDRADVGVSSDQVDHEMERKLNMSLAELELSVRATNCLESEGITTVRDLVIRTDEELLEVRNFGETTLKEVKQKLQERGMCLGMKLPSSLRSEVRNCTMRHLKAGRKLGRNATHRLALFRNLALALFRHERIITTEAKA